MSKFNFLLGSKFYKTGVIIRYYLGILFNVFIAYFYFSALLSGGLYDYEWDYHYNIFHQKMIVISCLTSAIAEVLILLGKKNAFYLFIISNFVFWVYFTYLESVDNHTYKSYMYIAVYPMFFIWAMCSIVNYFIDKKGKKIHPVQ